MNEIRNTNRDRLEELLANTPQQGEAIHARNMREANVLALIDLRDTIETAVSVGFGATQFGSIEFAEAIPGASYFYTEEQVRAALAAHDRLGDVEADHEAIIATLNDMVEGELAAGGALRAEGARVTEAVRGNGAVFPMTDDPRIDDSIVYDNTGDEPSTHLPVEHMPATDSNPSTDFDVELGPGDPETYEEGGEREGDEAPVDEAEADEEPDADLEDFAPSGQAPTPPVSGFEKIKKNKKKGKSA